MTNHRTPTLTTLVLAITTVAFLAACSPGGGASPTPEPTPKPTPTPIAQPVATLEEAAQVVLASDPRFAGVTKLDPNLIGASAWWEGRAVDGGFEIVVTIGWGDCPAGCINKHRWTYGVAGDASLTLVAEEGEPLPAGGVPAY